MTNKRPKYLTTPFVALALVFGAAACGSDSDSGSKADAEVVVTGAWVREPAAGQTVSAAYGLITNGGDEDVTLVGASAPIEGTIEIHQSVMADDGTMSMQERTEGFLVPVGGEISLEPGGTHVMIMGIEPTEIVGTIDVTFIFDSGLEVVVSAEVRPLDAEMAEMNEADGA